MANSSIFMPLGEPHGCDNRLEPKKPGYPGKNKMADHGNCKEVYYFSGGFRCTVLQEYDISLTIKHTLQRTSPKRQQMQSLKRYDSLHLKECRGQFKNGSEQSCYTLKGFGQKSTSRDSW